MSTILKPIISGNQKGKYLIFSRTKASDLFLTSVCHGAGPVRDCQLCGRVWFDATGEFMEEGELDDLLAKQKSDPDKYHSMDQQIHDGQIEGLQVVINCDCNGLKVYESFILDHQHLICDFLIESAKSRLKDAKEDLANATDASSAIRG